MTRETLLSQSVMNMFKPIELKYIWDKKTALLSTKLFYDYEYKYSYRRYLGWLFIAMVQFGVVGALKHDAYGMLVLSTVLVLYWYFLRYEIRKRIAMKQFNSSTLADREIMASLQDDGLFSEQGLIRFGDINHVVEYGKGFLIYTLNQALFFPKEAFVSSEDRSEFRAKMDKEVLTCIKEK